MRHRRWSPVSVVLFSLSLLLFVLNVYPATRVLWAGGGAWSSSAVANVHPDAPAGVAWTPSDCTWYPVTGPIEMDPGQAAEVKDLEALQCGPGPVGIMPGPDGATVATRAVYGPTGLTFYVPPAAVPLSGDAHAYAGGLQNAGPNSAYMLAFNEGARGGGLTLTVRDEAGRRIGTEYVEIDAKGFVFYRIATPFGAGSVTVALGYTGVDVGGGPSGPVWGWFTTGPEDSRAAAPRVVQWEAVNGAAGHAGASDPQR